METRFQPDPGLSVFVCSDGSGAAVFCQHSGDTHFLHVDSDGFERLLSMASFDLDDLVQGLALEDGNQAEKFANHLIALGIIDEVE